MLTDFVQFILFHVVFETNILFDLVIINRWDDVRKESLIESIVRYLLYWDSVRFVFHLYYLYIL